ncbi:MAG: hypothetical protein K2Y18_05795 [Alphaproteobacteria bacterium]|jgi:hypothetical protein|nr:hypothetical protein [Alphaproteobacteria bacterium]
MKDDSEITYKSEAVQDIMVQQYGILVETLNRINDTRESSNNFWIGANGLVVSVLAYLRDAQNIQQHHKSLLMLTLIMMGTLFCVSWLSYMSTIKKSVEIRSELLVKLEKNLPLQVFSKVFSLTDEKAGKAALTVKEMLVPGLFLIGYIFFAVLMLYFPHEVMACGGIM